MITLQLQQQIKDKAEDLGLWEEALTCALDVLSRNRDMVNALDNRSQMDEYIYHALIKGTTGKRRQQAEENLNSADAALQQEAERDLGTLSREELTTDPYYRAVLPIIVKIVATGPVLRLHAEEASDIVFKLADFKRMHRTTSLTGIIVTKCSALLDKYPVYSLDGAG